MRSKTRTPHGFQRKSRAPGPIPRVETRDKIERKTILRGPRHDETPLNSNAVHVLTALEFDRWQATVDVATRIALPSPVVVAALRELRAAGYAESAKLKPEMIGSAVAWKALRRES